MEVISYEEPRTWDDFGMNWSDPDPRCAHYVMAIRNAFLERIAATQDGHAAYSSSVFRRFSPWKAVSADALRQLILELEYLCRFYYDLNPERYKEDFSDFPKTLRFTDVVSAEDCDAFHNASRGAVLEHGGKWLRKIRNAICRLHVVQCHDAWGTTLLRYGTEHDPPFEESIGNAMAYAFGENQPSESEFTKTVPKSIYAWSGNNHWKCPDPNYDGDHLEENVDGYCGYAQCNAHRFRRLRRWLAGREVDFVVAAVVGPCTTPTGFSDELATSIFDGGGSDFERGLNIVRTHVEDPTDFDFRVGDIDTIPRNAVVPQSDFDDEGHAVWRRSAKRGFEGRMWAFLDYECENGFRFRGQIERRTYADDNYVPSRCERQGDAG